MFDIGFWELSLIMLLALLVLGPERLPGVVSTIGNWAGRARFMARSLRMQVERELAREVADSKKSADAKPAEPDAEESELRKAAEATQTAQEEALAAARAKQQRADRPAGNEPDERRGTD